MSTSTNATTNGAAAPARADLSHLTFLMHPALALLWQARELASEAFGDPDTEAAWAFAPQWSDLIALGLSEPQLRLLIVKSFLTCRGESKPKAESNGSSQQSSPNLTMLSAAGATALIAMLNPWYNGHAHHLQQIFSRRTVDTPILGLSTYSPSPCLPVPATAQQPTHEAVIPQPRFTVIPSAEKPHYDQDRRELWYAGHLIKRYKVPAKNQELILLAFDEEGWPARIDDPLPPTDDIEPKLRLRDTITQLNRHRRTFGLRFHGDGNGRGIKWNSNSSHLASPSVAPTDLRL